jgi:hypothetical protein
LEPRNPKARYRVAGTPSGSARWTGQLSDETQIIDSHEKFLKSLDKSRQSLFVIAAWLHKKGYTVTIPAIRYAPEHKDFPQYVDGGDMILTKEDGTQSVIEVKHLRNTDFTGLHDWPHPAVIVSNIHTVNRNRGRIKTYVIMNRAMTHIATIRADDIDKWQIKKIFASNTQKVESFYTCSPSDCRFQSLIEEKT